MLGIKWTYVNLFSVNGITYLFSGSKVYQLDNRRVENVHSLRQLFPKSPAYVQGALTEPKSGVTLLFQHGQVSIDFACKIIIDLVAINKDYPIRINEAIFWSSHRAKFWYARTAKYGIQTTSNFFHSLCWP